MAPVDGIAAVHVGGDGEPRAGVGPEGVDLMRRGMCAEYCGGVDVVRVGAAAAWVIRGEAEGVEVLDYADDGRESVVVLVRGESGFDQPTGD